MIHVDIILITYNQEQYVRQAVDSILMQQVDEGVKLHLVVADDVSTDQTLAIIRQSLADCKIEVEYVPKERNLGFVRNYQQVFGLCHGDFVAILEGDDYWLQGHIQQHVDFLITHPECSMAMNNHARLYIEDNRLEPPNQNCPDVRYVSLAEQLGCGNQLGNLTACVFRGDHIRALPDDFFNLNMADWELGVFMAQYGLLAILKESTSVYRISEKGQWAGLGSNEKKRQLLRDLHAMDVFFGKKYHSFCKKYQFKVCHPRLQTIKHKCGVAFRRILRK